MRHPSLPLKLIASDAKIKRLLNTRVFFLIRIFTQSLSFNCVRDLFASAFCFFTFGGLGGQAVYVLGYRAGAGESGSRDPFHGRLDGRRLINPIEP